MRPRVGAVGEAREPKGCGVDQGRIAGDHVGHQLAGARSDAEAVAGKPSRDKESRQALDRRDHRDRVGHDVDHAAPAFRNDRVAEHREGLGGGVARAIDDEAVGFGIKYPHRLERRSLVQTPTPRHAPFLDPATAHSEPQLLPMQPHRRKIVEEQSEMVGYEVDRSNPEGRDGVAAVHPLAEAEEAARGGNLRTALERLGPHYRGQDLELRELYAEIAAKEARPGAPREDDGIASNAPPFGSDSRRPAGRRLEAAHGATRNDRGSMPTRRLGDRWCGPLRLGLAVAGGVERPGPGPAQTGHQLRRLTAADDAGVELILAGMIEPDFEAGEP